MIGVIDLHFATCFFCVVNVHNQALIRVNRKIRDRYNRNIIDNIRIRADDCGIKATV